MNIVKKCTSFIKLDYRFKLLLLEAYVMLAWARYRKSIAFSKAATSLGKRFEETSYETDFQNREIIKNVSSALYLMSKYTFFESECLVKAMAGMQMLKRRNIESTLYLGTAKDETGLIAHAWLRCGNYYVSGKETMKKFTVVATFAQKMRNM